MNIGPTILASIGWGCSLNLLVGGSVAAKEGWDVPSVAFMGAPKILGKMGMFFSITIAFWAAGWWGLPIVIGGVCYLAACRLQF